MPAAMLSAMRGSIAVKAIARKPLSHNTFVRKLLQTERVRSPGVHNPAISTTGLMVLQRKPSCICDGGCPRCVPVQPKLKVNEPGDRYEQEADQIAEQVMRMPQPHLQRQTEPEEEDRDGEKTLQPKPLASQITPWVQRQEAEGEEEEEEEEPIQAKPLAAQISPLVQRQEGKEEEREEEDEEPIQAKPARGSTPHVGPRLATQIRSLKGGGRPLSRAERSFFEPRFGYDFSQVRILTDSRAARMARKVNAKAFTHGQHIVFGAGQYAGSTAAPKRLLAHELTHVVQQRRAAEAQMPAVQTWSGAVHRDLTRRIGAEIIPEKRLVNRLARASVSMDWRISRLARLALPYMMPYLRTNRSLARFPPEGPEHGEGGMHKIAFRNIAVARAINLGLQNQYVLRAAGDYRRSRKLANDFRKASRWRRTSLYNRCRETLARFIRNLGDALHIAQDRGSHWEGVRGRGHDDIRHWSIYSGWSPDNPKDNPQGYKNAMTYTREVLAQFARLARYPRRHPPGDYPKIGTGFA
jgi:hypothetical protein